MKKSLTFDRAQKRLARAVDDADKQQQRLDMIVMMAEKMLDNGMYLVLLGKKKKTLVISTFKHTEIEH